ncbi:hypothetical protein HDU76_003057 [Blyttiomyces sp. JEL0837]|nr:hypothetical protein HDU76_003057 [Blyttiomyces sp. JEL0837]
MAAYRLELKAASQPVDTTSAEATEDVLTPPYNSSSRAQSLDSTSVSETPIISTANVVNVHSQHTPTMTSSISTRSPHGNLGISIPPVSSLPHFPGPGPGIGGISGNVGSSSNVSESNSNCSSPTDVNLGSNIISTASIQTQPPPPPYQHHTGNRPATRASLKRRLQSGVEDDYTSGGDVSGVISTASAVGPSSWGGAGSSSSSGFGAGAAAGASGTGGSKRGRKRTRESSVSSRGGLQQLQQQQQQQLQLQQQQVHHQYTSHQPSPLASVLAPGSNSGSSGVSKGDDAE